MTWHLKFDPKIVFKVRGLGHQLFELDQTDVATAVEVGLLQDVPDDLPL